MKIKDEPNGMFGYTKAKQSYKKEKTHIVCSECGKKRLLKFFSSKQARKCGDCKRKAWRLKKQSSPGKIREREDNNLRKIVVERDNHTCQWCMKKLEGRNCHLSHVFSKGAHPDLRHDPLNVKILCYHCHIQKWHKDPDIAIRWFKGKFPDRYKYLRGKIKDE